LLSFLHISQGHTLRIQWPLHKLDVDAMLLRIVMHVDFDYFFAQVEERENPAIRDKPVVVCVYSGRSEDSGAVSTANYIARKYGVKSGIPISLAKKKLRDVESAFLPVNHTLYDAVSEKIMNIVHSYADRFEQIGVDEAFLEVTEEIDGSFERARELAEKIKKEIFDKEKITCSIGIGPNKLIAKIAAGRQKPNGLTVVRTEEIERFLSPLPVRKLVGVGTKTEKVLHKLGIKTIGELAKQNLDKLTSVFGMTFGAYLHAVALGRDKSPVQQRGRAESISRITTLKENTRDIAEMLKQIQKLAEDVHSKSMQQGLSFKSVSVVAVMEDLKMRSRSKTFQNPTKNLDIIKNTARALLQQLLRDETEGSVRRVGIKIFNLAYDKEQKQLNDFG
jgi:DNA polymerase IV (DinB-like DNA polymerase)